IWEKTFSVTRRGYDKAEVASYLARVAYEIEQGSATPTDEPAEAEARADSGPTSEKLAEHGEPRGDGDLFAEGTDQPRDQPAAATGVDDDEAFVAAMSDRTGDDPSLGPDPDLAGATAEHSPEWTDITRGDEADREADDEAQGSSAEAEPSPSAEVEVAPAASLDTLLGEVAPADTRPKLPGLPPIPELPDQAATAAPRSTSAGSRLSFDDDGFQQAAAEITSLMRQAHESALRLRAQAENEVRATIESTETELSERRRIQLEHLEAQRHQAEVQIADARRDAEMYVSETKTRADRYLAETRAEADSYAERQRSQADTDSKALLAEAESYARATTENADDYDRRSRADADSYAARVRAEAETAAKRIIDEAEKVTVEMRATAEKQRNDSAEVLEKATAEAEAIRRAAHDEADRILHSARTDAVARSSDVLERGRALVQSLASLESDSRRRLVEAQQAINSALDATTVTQLPDAALNDRIDQLTAELDELAESMGDADAG
ncbi:MAG: DivIVA domain-containing protein, partial [Acidimicrobiales bacterium]